MISDYELLNQLKSIIELLKQEKHALLDNDGDKVADMIVKKNEYIDKLSQFRGTSIENNVKAMNLIKEINSLQEVNLLLTRQALSFQNVLLESIAKSIHKMTNTYSVKGNYQSTGDISIVDQSV